MHPPVEAGEVGEIAQRAQGTKGERIEQPDGNVGMVIQLRQRIIQPWRIVIVQQQPYDHPAIGGLQHGTEQQPARHIVLPDIVLYIQRLRGFLHQQVTCGKSIQPVTEWMNAAQPRMVQTKWNQPLFKPALP